MKSLTARQTEIIRALADTLIPTIQGTERHPQDFWERKGSEVIEATDIAEALAGLSPAVQQEFMQLLQLMDSPLLGLMWNGPWKGFLNLTPGQRTRMLEQWTNSKIGLARKGMASLKKIFTFLYYTKPLPHRNPNWQALGYPGPLDESAPPSREKLPLYHPKEDHITCEVLVIGSGAGGGVVAGELAAAGKDVLVVEKGPYLDRPEYNQLEAEMVSTMYESRGALTTQDGGVTVFAGSCLGGGTTINWAGSFDTPDYILHEWATEHGLPDLTDASFRSAQQAVARAIGVNTQYRWHNHQNQALQDGSRALGHEPKLIPRNERGLSREDFQGLGFSAFGDRYGKKQGTLATYLREATAHGARVLPNTNITRITHAQGRATGAEGYLDQGNGPRPIRITAKRVVVSAGAIHTPVLLRKSGLRHPHLGQHLYFHPTVAVSAFYGKVNDPAWTGPMMSVVNDHFSQLTGNYGFKLETPPAHVGLSALALPWINGDEHKRMMLKLTQLSHFIVLVRDREGGSVSVDKHGFPRLRYKPSKFDMAHLLRGMQEAARIHCAAGAEEVIFPHYALYRMACNEDEANRESFLQSIPSWGWKPNQYALFSAHQMGTARMGGNAKTHPVAPNGETREVKNLFVADASLFPAASGVNPMLTIMTLAHLVAQGLKN